MEVEAGKEKVKTVTSLGGRVRIEPRLYHNCGNGIRGWRADKKEAKERRAFRKLSPREANRIEADKLSELRETLRSIWD